MPLDELKLNPRDRLHLIAVHAIRESDRSAEKAVTKFLENVMEDGEPELLVELFGADVAITGTQKYLRKVLEEDMDGGGIGLRPVNESGSNAVADAAGQLRSGSHNTSARPSAPHSETPAEKPVGGGQKNVDIQLSRASPTPPVSSKTAVEAPLKNTAWSLKDIQSQKRETQVVTPAPAPAPKKPYVAPKERISAAAQLRAKNVVAAGFLNTTIVRGRPLGEWRKGEALALTERTKWDCLVLDRFCEQLPTEETAIGEFYTEREAENIWKELEASRGKKLEVIHAS